MLGLATRPEIRPALVAAPVARLRTPTAATWTGRATLASVVLHVALLSLIAVGAHHARRFPQPTVPIPFDMVFQGGATSPAAVPAPRSPSSDRHSSPAPKEAQEPEAVRAPTAQPGSVPPPTALSPARPLTPIGPAPPATIRRSDPDELVPQIALPHPLTAPTPVPSRTLQSNFPAPVELSLGSPTYPARHASLHDTP